MYMPGFPIKAFGNDKGVIMAESIKLYLKDIKDVPLLTAEEELALAKRVVAGEEAARTKMIKSNLRLVINIAKRYRHFGVPLVDLIEEGNLGLIKAVSKFNPEKGFRFSTYASWWIRQYVNRGLANQGKIIRIPVYLVESIIKYKKCLEELAQKHKRRPRPSEIAKLMKVPTHKVRLISTLVTKVASLETPVGEDDAGQFIDLIEDEAASAPDDQIYEFLRNERIEALLEKMKHRDAQVLQLRYGLKDGRRRTLAEVAKHFGITRERVRQIEKGALKKLKRGIEKS